jgi:hypothetical protein
MNVPQIKVYLKRGFELESSKLLQQSFAEKET